MMRLWSIKSGELAAASSHDFERRVLHLLRAFWPNLIRPRETQRLDRHGIDLLVWSDNLSFPCVVQCKGLYQDEKLVTSQWPQISNSIDAFKNSPFTATDYVLVHNRTREEQEIHQRIETKLSELKESGKAQKTTLWDRQTLMSKTKDKLQELIADHLVAKSNWLLEQQKRFFSFGELFVATVPVTSRKWIFRSGGDVRLEKEGPPFEANVSDLISQFNSTRWTLLVGHFGTGKSRTALQAATHAKNKLIYCRCQDLPNPFGGIGTNYLMQNIVRSLELFSDWEDETRLELEKLSGPILSSILRKPNTDFSIVIDGIDESNTYGVARGMTQLTNELAELKCPIVLTTRKEHFDSTFGNYESALEELTKDTLSVKGGNQRDATVLELQSWSEKQISQFLEQAIKEATPEQKVNIRTFAEMLLGGQAYEFITDLSRHPLFLHMMLELASDGIFDISNRVKLIERWVRRKIKRDLSVPRLTPFQVTDKNSFVEQIMTLMEKVAYAMTTKKGTGRYLLETIDSTSVEHLAIDTFKTKMTVIDISTIVTTSLIVPAAKRHADIIPVKFYHRIFHEYFLARYVHRKEIFCDDELPNMVIEFCTELDHVDFQ